MIKYLLTLAWGVMIAAQVGFSQTGSQRNSVQVTATVSSNSIVLSWPAWSGATGYTIYRKLKTDSSWGSAIGTTSQNSFTDSNVSTAVYYEYKVVRATSNGTGYGYIASGREVAPTDYRGRLLLLVDNTFTSSLATQLTQLEEDLVLDGWSVARTNLDRWSSVAVVKAAVLLANNSYPDLKAIYIIGHLAVPYSGNINPDGHNDHLGAWPCDGYYGELNGSWTDTSNPTNGSQSSRNWNDPGDGKFDQSDFPSSLELAVGRVDMYHMVQNGGAFNYYQSLTESQLLASYLTRAHNFKTKQTTPQFRGAVFDNFDDVSEPLAGSGYRSISALVGTSNLTDFNPNTSTPFSSYINNQSYLWTYFSGGGTWVSASNVGNTDQFAGSSGSFTFGGVFNMSLGSYFGDWDIVNSFLVSPIASGGLTNVWAGLPNWWFHHMGMGDPIYYSAITSINNQTTYVPQNGGWQTSPYSRVQMNLLGDPSLRNQMVSMPSNLQVSNVGGSCQFTWQAASQPVLGYHVYEINTSTGAITRLTSNLVATTSYNSTTPYAQGKVFMVRSVVLQTTPTGTYYNLSLGSKKIAPASTSPLVRVSPKVFLEGPYKSNEGLMIDSLRSHGLLPLTQPYLQLGYTHTANSRSEVISNSVLLTTGPSAIVDWVIVELRNPTTNTVTGSRTGLLQRDGDVVEMDGFSPLEFDLPADNYKIAIRHRNHLAVMTNSGFSLSSSTTIVDFSTVLLYGTNPRSPNGSMWLGDVDFNGVVKYVGTGNDRDLILVNLGGDPHAIATQFYSGADTNMDGKIRYTGSGNDRDPILVVVGSTTPNNIRTQQLP